VVRHLEQIRIAGVILIVVFSEAARWSNENGYDATLSQLNQWVRVRLALTIYLALYTVAFFWLITLHSMSQSPNSDNH
jgi:hypothetical protein